MLTQRAQFHQARLTEHIQLLDPNVRAALSNFGHLLFSRGIPLPVSQHAALGGLYGQIIRQSMMLAFNDVFHILFLFALGVVPLALLFRKAEGGPPIGAH